MTSKVIEGHKSSSNFNVFLSDFFLLPNTFIYESILIKMYMNANIMNTQIFQNKISMTSKVIEGQKSSIFFWSDFFFFLTHSFMNRF